ncbi:FAD/NAD(P)-binding domain-containing protein [Xylariomycetidae sp. FL0641]|nr:FAD/NAD(P)-binding domain-containing protein [Xylariomycetidae sp. FL0641]
MTGSPATLRVAIIGGGITGAALLCGLRRHPHVAVDLYEPRPVFREEGHGIDLTARGATLLCALNPDLEPVVRAGAVPSAPTVRIAAGPSIGRYVPSSSESWMKLPANRQFLLEELLRGANPNQLHTNAQIVRIINVDGGQAPIVLEFAGGARAEYDVLVGADGAHGFTRERVLGTEHRTLRPQHTGFWGLSVRVPVERAVEAGLLMGTEAAGESWVGDGTLVQLDRVTGDADVSISASATHEERGEGGAWAQLFTPEEFGDIFESSAVPAVQAMIKLVQNVYTVQIAAICQMQHRPVSSYVTKRAALVGDAAHAMATASPGISLVIALEEALVLSTLLGRATSPSSSPRGIAAALRAFDVACRPRAETAVRVAAEGAALLTGRAPGIGLDPDGISAVLKQQWAFLTSIGVEELQDRAIQVMNQLVGN